MIDKHSGKKIVSPLDIFTLPEGSIVKINGFPFQLLNATVVSGDEANYKLSLSHLDISSDSPIQAASLDN
jgi:hypothetical protein